MERPQRKSSKWNGGTFPACRRWTFLLALAVLAWSGLSTPGWCDLPYEQEPINYLQAPTTDTVSRLQQQINDGTATLEHDAKSGYLRSLLEHLRVPVSSQAFVFSKTSFQRSRIAPRTPRAVYFGDEVYVGFCQSGDVLELSAVDPRQGAVFYTLSQQSSDRPQFVRQNDNCLVCHSSSKTADVPGHLVRSVYSDTAGQPVFSAGTYNTNQDSPFHQRWGGWYVTGKHGNQSHMGNVCVEDKNQPDKLNTAAGANVVDLRPYFNPSPYLSPHSDIVALMVLEHQTHMQNLITRAGFDARLALSYNDALNKAFKEEPGHRSESTTRRLKNAGESLLKYLLFTEEAPLTAPIEGTAGFTQDFSSLGPRDKQGRSLRDFDLRTRLFKYPCSYLIYSRPFDALPVDVKENFYRRLWEILTGVDQQPSFARLDAATRQAILEILRDTKSDLPAYWLADK